MRLTTQRYNECLLASICMVLGADYPLASENFAARFGVAWGDTERSVPHWQTFTRDYFGVRLPSAVAGPFAFTVGQDNRVFSNGGILVWVNYNTLAAHATAYDPGTQSVLDPAGQMMNFCDYQRISGMQFAGAFTLEGV